MKKILCAVLAGLACQAMAQTNARVENSLPKADAQGLLILGNQLGTGTPAPMITVGEEKARYVDDSYYHVPQYMPQYPTSAIIWPRVVEVDCDKNPSGTVVCDGYHWLPKLGRGEYLFVVPRMKNQPAPVVAPPVIIYKDVYKEVPAKKKKE